MSKNQPVVTNDHIEIHQNNGDKFFRYHELGVSPYVFDEMEDEQEIEALCQKLGINSPDELNEVSDEAWNWWVKLSPSTKFILLYSIPRDYEEFGDFELPYCVDDMLCVEDESELEFDFESEDNRRVMSVYLTDHIFGLDSIDITAAEEAEESSCLEYEFEELAYLPNLTEMSFYRGDWCYFPSNLTALKHLTVLNFARTEIGGDTPEEDLENLFEFAKSHPQMEVLDLSGTPLADDLSDEQVDELQALMPNCEIKL